MDNQYNPNSYIAPYNPGNQQQQPLGSFGGLPPQHHQQESPSHATLPPLQSQNGGYQYGGMGFGHAGSQSQTPTTPHTPVSGSMNGSNSNAYQHMSTNPHQGSMLPPSSYHQAYSSQSMQYQSSSATSMPPTSASVGLPNLRPMPPGGMTGLPSLSTGGQLGQQPSFMQNEETPTHVVGSQGRRGILPSAPGRPNPPAQGTQQNTKSLIPQKDADGKFPCPHCNKTYLHAKHLKRHLLRHTGDRPYMCHLCKDTFSRSDILKRHFQKCSIRRGNPTGANHLAHQRRNTNGTNRLSMGQQDGPIGLAGLQEVSGNNYTDGMTASPTVNGDVSGRSSRANSIISPAQMSHRGSIAGLGILGSNAGQSDPMGSSAAYQPGMTAYSTPNSSGASTMHNNYAFNNPQMSGNVFNTQSQMPFLGHQSSRFGNSHENSPHQNGDGSGMPEWNRMFNSTGQDGFIGSQPANTSSQQIHVKTENETKPNFTMHDDMSSQSFLGSLYSHPNAFGSEYGENDHGILGFPNWSPDDPLQSKVDSLIQYCFPQGIEAAQGEQTAHLVRECLTLDNVKHFAEHYTSFHGHWPILHMPTFKITDANDGLVLAIICIGAIYSPKMSVAKTRQMMDFVHSTIMTNCTVYNRTMTGQIAGLGSSSWETDEMQALIILQVMMTWHGEPHQRQTARNELPAVVRTARAMGLCYATPPGHYAYSVLHFGQHHANAQVDVGSWRWHGWLEQERRNRALYMLFLSDAASVMYFNNVPQLDAFEIRLSLPADDAAWDAKDPESCASALGLYGPQAQIKNQSGTRRPRQPGMREAMRTLMDPSVNFQPSATNAYSKFVLIHALIVRIIACQKTVLLQQENAFQGFNMSGSTPATPLSQNDWLEQRSGSATSSGHVTPTDGLTSTTAAQQEKKRLDFALARWKRTWDSDMDLQYPPSSAQLRRFGFSRDGVHFFYLGRSFLQTHRATDWTAPPDVRFKQVMSYLKRIKSMVVGDNESKGQDIGSVGDIDEMYGVDDLTLDSEFITTSFATLWTFADDVTVKLLFKPYNSQIDSPVASVQTHSF
ncbi:uncharacterized protein LTR77_007929 [Saxophila tyrrhenica]|uniref:C2H2-type domain-containing protein n=1 Tax=Saxophila tyrrhenica TaxID=1690608 RepID=A0AAV9P7D7_9PEZI|nr:hypothetical protein LTR77_007929 [Saxophila tyrrhenica]